MFLLIIYLAQLKRWLSAAVGTYIREMDVDPGLFDLMVQKGKDSIKILSDTELRRLNIVNNGRKKSQRLIEAYKGGQYLRGVQESVYGQGEAAFYCSGNGKMIFQSFYEVDVEKATSICFWWLEALIACKWQT